MRDEIIEILEDIKSGVDYESGVNLIKDGILTSLKIFSLVSALEDAFDIEIGADLLLPENFETVDAIEALVSKLAED